LQAGGVVAACTLFSLEWFGHAGPVWLATCSHGIALLIAVCAASNVTQSTTLCAALQGYCCRSMEGCGMQQQQAAHAKLPVRSSSSNSFGKLPGQDWSGCVGSQFTASLCCRQRSHDMMLQQHHTAQCWHAAISGSSWQQHLPASQPPAAWLTTMLLPVWLAADRSGEKLTAELPARRQKIMRAATETASGAQQHLPEH
jgi:hypothetical protein